MKQFLLFIILCLCCGSSIDKPDANSQYLEFSPDRIPFRIAAHSWNVDGLGNHRAVVFVGDNNRDAVKVMLPWRRGDRRPETKKVIVVDARTGNEIRNVALLDFSPEKAEILFEPQRSPGNYYIYYLPYKYRKGSGDARYGEPWNDYLPADYSMTDVYWEKTNREHVDEIPYADVKSFESNTSFDFLTPMGLIATKEEADRIRNGESGDFSLFPEDRAYPIRLTHALSMRFGKNGTSNKMTGYACANEYYTWQIGVWANKKDLKNLKVEFSDFKHSSNKGTIKKEDITCFNLQGINWDGKPVSFKVDILQNTVQPLWFGVQIPPDIRTGKYNGKVMLLAENASSQVIDIEIEVENHFLADKGDGDLWRHSRLRWLNSTIGIDDLPVKPYEKLLLKQNKIFATGKSISIGQNGLLDSISVGNRQVFSRPMQFIVETEDEVIPFKTDPLSVIQKAEGLVEWKASGEKSGISLDCTASMEYDGYIRYHISLSAEKSRPLKTVRLVMNYAADASVYFMGIGYGGGKRPEKYAWNWVGPWDSYWIGSAHAGLHMEFRGGTYHGPLLNDYKPLPPPAWNNQGRGRIELEGSGGEHVELTASTGPMALSPKTVDFEFSMLMTPVKPLNTSKHFSERYYHSAPEGFGQAAKEGANIANIHHARSLNPVINYPFIVREPLMSYIREQHRANRKVKLYYTIRELSNHAVEIYALKSLNHEIFVAGPGYGVPWLCEHLIDDYKPAWYTELPNEQSDAALVLNGFSRWINYYLEGLRWMLENYQIDGIYMDDVSFDRETMKRIRKIMEKYRPSALIDLHSNTNYSIGPANQYTDFFPYVDRLWFGESFKYNQMSPEEWFVTFSGIPFGVMSEMLQDGGNRYLGMVYGATARHSYGPYSPAPVWNLWESFGIEKAKMIGYWEKKCPVKTNDPDVKATIFTLPDKVLIAVGNFSSEEREVRLSVDWNAVGIDSTNYSLELPPVKDFQEGRELDKQTSLKIKSKEGRIYILKNK